MDQGDGEGVGGLIHQGNGKDGVGQHQKRQQNQRADNFNGNMDNGHPLGVGVGADAGEEGGDAGADVGAHDDGNRHGVGDGAGQRQGLQDTDGGGGALDQAGEQGADQNAQKGVVEPHHHFGELGKLRQGADGVLHQVHAVHQYGEADADGADAFALVVFGKHQHQDADKGHDGGKVLRLEHLDKDIAALYAGEG